MGKQRRCTCNSAPAPPPPPALKRLRLSSLVLPSLLRRSTSVLPTRPPVSAPALLARARTPPTSSAGSTTLPRDSPHGCLAHIDFAQVLSAFLLARPAPHATLPPRGAPAVLMRLERVRWVALSPSRPKDEGVRHVRLGHLVECEHLLHQPAEQLHTASHDGRVARPAAGGRHLFEKEPAAPAVDDGTRGGREPDRRAADAQRARLGEIGKEKVKRGEALGAPVGAACAGRARLDGVGHVALGGAAGCQEGGGGATEGLRRPVGRGHLRGAGNVDGERRRQRQLRPGKGGWRAEGSVVGDCGGEGGHGAEGEGAEGADGRGAGRGGRRHQALESARHRRQGRWLVGRELGLVPFPGVDGRIAPQRLDVEAGRRAGRCLPIGRQVEGAVGVARLVELRGEEGQAPGAGEREAGEDEDGREGGGVPHREKGEQQDQLDQVPAQE
eukprot:scaffold20179_cov103-Isochrysis_galbana.AAC.2